MFVRSLGSPDSPLDNVTVSTQCWIYSSGKDTDRQKPTVGHKNINKLGIFSKYRNRKNILLTYYSPKKSDTNSTNLNLFWGK